MLNPGIGISNRLKLMYPNVSEMNVSHEEIYKYIYNLTCKEERLKFIKCLRRRKKYRYSRKCKNDSQSNIYS